ncbi:MAG: hypothetical protein JWQ72_3346 [Polaromonas sp.]|nr:hypothetical protein [Polaromonas sp.]
MYQLIQNAAGGRPAVVAYEGEQKPQFAHGVWECGSARFTDERGSAYSVQAAAAVYPQLKPMQFYLAFTALERQAIKASANTLVREFWDTYERAERTDTPIDPNSPAVQQGLGYLSLATDATPAGAGLLLPARVPQILAGVAA